MIRAQRASAQLALELRSAEPSAATEAPALFRRLYYHLYSNSAATRAERIIEDLALLLLLKLAAEQEGADHLLASFRAGAGDANTILLPFLRARYPDLVDDRQRFSLHDDTILTALDDLSALSLTRAPAHVLGDAFQALMGPRIRGEKGQFFTPRSLVRCMVSVLDPQPHESVLDPACGTGGFLAEAHTHQVARGPSTGSLIGIDKDHDLARLASALLRICSSGRARVHNFNSLDASRWAALPEAPFDVILTNPPFGARIGLTNRDLLAAYDLGHHWDFDATWSLTKLVRASQDPQTLFLELCVRHLRPGGRLGIVLPEGLFGNRKSGYVWDWLREQGEIFALLDCPRTTFQPGTDTKTNVLFFRKAQPGRPSKRKTVVALALHCGHDRRGATTSPTGQPLQDDFQPIGRSFGTRTRSSWWHPVALADPYYLVPRYHLQEVSPSPDEAALLDGAPTATLAELVEAGLLSIRKGHEVGSEAYGGGSVPFIRTSDVANFEVNSDPTKAISQALYEQYAPQQNLRPGDLLLVVDGRYRIGATAILTGNNVRCVVQSHFRILTALDHSRLDPYELLFALTLDSVRARLRNLVFIQSTLGTIGKRLRELRVPLLHGQGPWTPRVAAFRQILQQRDTLLNSLTTMVRGGVEL